MRIAILICLTFFGTICSGQVLFEIFPDTVTTYIYGGGDEFNGQALDQNLWKNGIGGRRVLIVQDLAFEPSNVKFDKDMVVFVADKNDSNYLLTQWEVDSSYLRRTNRALPDSRFQVKYSAGAIVSKQKYHYGVYELRFKVEQGKGIWPAFWFYGGTKNEEIDVFELKGERNNEIHVDVHCPSGCAHGYRKTRMSLPRSYGSWIRMSEFLHEGFNNVMLDWRENELYWYINGYPFAYFRGTFSKPMNVFLNTSVAKTGEAFSPGPDSTTAWPNNYFVDYLRIWRPAGGSEVLKLAAGDFSTSSRFPSKAAIPVKRRGVAYSKKKLNKLQGTVGVTRNTQNEVTISTLGCINKKTGNIKAIIGQDVYEIKSSDPETKLVIKDTDKTLTLEFKLGKKSYSTTLQLR